MRKKIFTLLAIFLAFTAVTMQAQTVQDTTRHEVLLETDSGDIRIELFNETPKHRDNFLRLVRSGAYDGVLFHRVIKDFMIQTGDVGSKNAKPGGGSWRYARDLYRAGRDMFPEAFPPSWRTGSSP